MAKAQKIGPDQVNSMQINHLFKEMAIHLAQAKDQNWVQAARKTNQALVTTIKARASADKGTQSSVGKSSHQVL